MLQGRSERTAACTHGHGARSLLGATSAHRHLLQIEESGRLCLFLASDATFITGAEQMLTGGAELSYGAKARRTAETDVLPLCE